MFDGVIAKVIMIWGIMYCVHNPLTGCLLLIAGYKLDCYAHGRFPHV